MFSIRTFAELNATQHALDVSTHYRRHVPLVILGLPSPTTEKALDRFFGTHNVEVPAQFAYDLSGAILVRPGITMTHDAVAAESLYNIGSSKSFFGFDRDGEGLTRSDAVRDVKPGDYVNLMLTTESVFGHWLFELVPKIDAAIRLGFGNRKFIVSWRTPMSEQLRLIMRAYGLDAGTQLERGFDHPTTYGRVAFMPHRNHYPDWKSPAVTLALEDLGYRLTPIEKRPKRRLYVTREDAGDRQLLNSLEIEELLATHGFEKIVSAAMPLDEQVATFRDAEIVVGVTGSALSNIVFSERGTPVVFLSTEHMAGTWFYDICSQKEHPYAVVFGPAVEAHSGGVAPYRQNFSVEASHVASAIETLLPSSG